MSSAATLFDRGRLEIKLGHYGVGSATALSDPTILAKTQGYRRMTGSRMVPLGKSDVRVKLPVSDFHASRKIDGEFTVLVLREGEIFSLNPGGTLRVGLPWHAEALEALDQAGIREAMIAGEMYVHRADRRSRVHDVTRVARQPQSAEELQSLRFGVFDVISLDDQPPSETFADTFRRIEELFSGRDLVHPVETEVLAGAASVEKLFTRWVEQEHAEGIVLRSDHAGTFKLKPRHTIDAVVVGFTEATEDRQGLLHDLLVAVMRADATMHVLCRVGGGFDEQQRRSMLSDLKDMVVSSEYAEVNSDYVAYQMVRPQWVVEVSCLDLIAQTTRGGHVNRMVLDYDADGGYSVVRRMPLAAVISPQFVRLREDKQAHPSDVRISQLSDRVEVAMTEVDAKKLKLPATQVLRREVFTKQLKGATMVRKFVLLKTNKEAEADEYPAYVLHYTDFSPNRKEPLSRDVVVSNSQAQIEQWYAKLKDANVKKGWIPITDDQPSDAQASFPGGQGLNADGEASSPQTDVATKTPRKKPSNNRDDAIPRKAR